MHNREDIISYILKHKIRNKVHPYKTNLLTLIKFKLLI